MFLIFSLSLRKIRWSQGPEEAMFQGKDFFAWISLISLNLQINIFFIKFEKTIISYILIYFGPNPTLFLLTFIIDSLAWYAPQIPESLFIFYSLFFSGIQIGLLLMICLHIHWLFSLLSTICW